MSAPTGTIFELDMFRERLERLCDDYDSELYVRVDKVRDFATELLPLINNVQAQYCPSAPPSDEGEPPAEINTRRQGDGTLAVYVDHKFVGVVDERQNASPFDHPDVRRLVDAAEEIIHAWNIVTKTNEEQDSDEAWERFHEARDYLAADTAELQRKWLATQEDKDQ